MKILHVISSVDPRAGGPSQLVRRAVQEHVRSGHQVSLLTTSVQEGEPWEPKDLYLQSVVNDPAFRDAELFVGRSYGRWRPWSSLAYSPVCAQWLRHRLADPQRSPEVVHLHGILQYVTMMAASAARRCGVPYIVEPYGVLDPYCMNMGFRRLKQLTAKLVVPAALKEAGCIQVASEQEADVVARWASRDRIRVVPHGVDLPDIRPEMATSFQRRFPLLRGKRILLFLGRIHAKKQPELIVEAMAHLRPEMNDLALAIVGSDEDHLHIVQDVARRHGLTDSVIHCGFLEGEAKHEAFAAASLFVLPSLDENFGIAVVEAMACSVPVLVTPGVATHSYVDQSGAGMTVEPHSAALADGLRCLLRLDRQVVGQKGRAFVEEHLSWPSIHRQIDRIYADLLGGQLHRSEVTT